MHPTIFPSSFSPQNIPALEEHLDKLRVIWEKTRLNLESASLSQKRAADRRRRPPPVYHVGDRVWLSTRHIRLKVPSMKFAPRFIGPYKILRCINPVVYALQLPVSLRIPNSFHVSLLKPLSCNRFTRPDSPPPPVVVDGTPEYEIESILDSRYVSAIGCSIWFIGLAMVPRIAHGFRHVTFMLLDWSLPFIVVFPDRPAPSRPVGVPQGGGAVRAQRAPPARRPAGPPTRHPSSRLRGRRPLRVLCARSRRARRRQFR
uniref:Tf2-1-like SH3-like domain-containing protein n=1 Tax=Leptobrachium leishanense TaxID=445787 RepID=A0A8C5WLW7_9ANUR